MKCTVHYIVHLQCTFSLSLSLSLIRMKVVDSTFQPKPQETIEQSNNTVPVLYRIMYSFKG